MLVYAIMFSKLIRKRTEKRMKNWNDYDITNTKVLMRKSWHANIEILITKVRERVLEKQTCLYQYILQAKSNDCQKPHSGHLDI